MTIEFIKRTMTRQRSFDLGGEEDGTHRVDASDPWSAIQVDQYQDQHGERFDVDEAHGFYRQVGAKPGPWVQLSGRLAP
jgi:hypothetical protein